MRGGVDSTKDEPLERAGARFDVVTVTSVTGSVLLSSRAYERDEHENGDLDEMLDESCPLPLHPPLQKTSGEEGEQDDFARSPAEKKWAGKETRLTSPQWWRRSRHDASIPKQPRLIVHCVKPDDTGDSVYNKDC
ncbi:hypothetical protein C0Q70_21045 [Pomacea canaliculata]|uniref:Uncharacterized protein n=1 Tax=Pomacea canaliculata TaxID=400727 RepID=A0A2T7NBE2_POMCA|nr:hypothetical protein C0Q70_21045 [Pomacea canaliculata]